MPTSKPRPVPSIAALRILYQLAYVCSGTAVGVGVLCAEESRRRTQILQRIADNAKVIRQHTRYAANTASAVRDDEGDGCEHAQMRGQDEVRHRGSGTRRRDPPAKGRFLPSVVEEEYRVAIKQRRRGAKAESDRSVIPRAEKDCPVIPRAEKEGLAKPVSGPTQGRANEHRLMWQATPPPLRASGLESLNPLEYARYRTPKPSRGLNGIMLPLTPHATKSRSVQMIKHQSRHRQFSTAATQRHEDIDCSLDEQPETRLPCMRRDADEGRQIEKKVSFVPVFKRGHSHRQDSKRSDNEGMDGILESPSLQAAGACQATERPKLDSPMIKRCGELLDQRRVSEAVDTYLSLHRKERSQEASDLFNRVFADALSAKLFQQCAYLLRLHAAPFPSPATHCETFVHACEQEGDYGAILDCFFRTTHPISLEHLQSLSMKTRAILAMACATDSSLYGYFDPIFQSLNARSRSALNRKRLHLLLTCEWRSSKNLDAVHANLRPMVKHAEAMHDAKTLEAIDRCMAKLYISADRTTQALAVIARRHDRDGVDRLHNMLLAAVAYSKRNSWFSVHKILRCAESQHRNKSYSGSNRQSMQALVKEFSLASTGRQLWKFVSYLKDKFRFRPSPATHRIVLRSFASDRGFLLIPHWLRMLKREGRSLELNSEMAAQLLSYYYHKHRPPHILVMWFCRNLARSVPGLDAQAFHALIMRSIGYDMAGGMERNAPWQQHHARTRLARLRASESSIPSPGHTYDRKLYFTHTSKPEGAQISSGTESGPILEDEDIARLNKIPIAPNTGTDHMYMELYSRRYRKVLKMYEDSLDVFSCPPSPQHLNLAVRASLKVHGHDEHALQMIHTAGKAGLLTKYTMTPVLVHRMQNLDNTNSSNAQLLQAMAVQHYQIAGDNSNEVAPYVGVTAANLLISRGYAAAGLDVLQHVARAMFRRRSSDNIVVMTVMVKAYVELRNIHGVAHCAQKALKADVLVTPHFVRELRRGLKEISPSSARERARLVKSIHLCEKRRRHQAVEAGMVGKKLVAVIARCMRDRGTVDIDVRSEIDAELFGATSGHGSSSETEVEPAERAAAAGSGLTRRERIARNRERVSKAIGYDVDVQNKVNRHANYLTDVAWMRQYRAFLRQPIVLEDGRYASYRYYLPALSKRWRGKESSNRALRRKTAENFGWEMAGQ